MCAGQQTANVSVDDDVSWKAERGDLRPISLFTGSFTSGCSLFLVGRFRCESHSICRLDKTKPPARDKEPEREREGHRWNVIHERLLEKPHGK